MEKKDFSALIARAKAAAEAKKTKDALDAMLALADNADTVDVAALKVDATTEEGKEAVVDILVGMAEAYNTTAPAKKNVMKLSLNERQQEFVDLALSGSDCVLIGSAGTGKTTCMQRVTKSLIEHSVLKPITEPTAWLKHGSLGAAIVSFTRKAVNNIRHAVVDELKANTITLHKLLEFEPTFFDVIDESTGKTKSTMSFMPKRCSTQPLPDQLTFIAFEESSMIGCELYALLQDAMPHRHQEVFLGDIQQLPPVFGLSVLGFKMLDLPVVELTEIYRQAKMSPIIDLASAILSGDIKRFNPKTETFKAYHDAVGKVIPRIKVPALEVFSRKGYDEDTGAFMGEVVFQVFQQRLSDTVALNSTVQQFIAWEKSGYWNPDEDIILIPFNKNFGTLELNRALHNHLGKKRGALVHEVIAGFERHYLAVGDRVLYDKEDAVITAIEHNAAYLGIKPQLASVSLDRYGTYQNELTSAELETGLAAEAAQDLASAEALFDSPIDVEDRVTAASHTITIALARTDEVIKLSGAGDVNTLLGGNALTVYKFQGSQERKVFFIMHHSHAVANCREMLYTAVTRPTTYLHIICEVDTFYKGVASQKIKGNTIAAKAEFFKGKVKNAAKDAMLAKKKSLDLFPRDIVKDAPVIEEVIEEVVEEAPQKLICEVLPPAEDKLAKLRAKLKALQTKGG